VTKKLYFIKTILQTFIYLLFTMTLLRQWTTLMCLDFVLSLQQDSFLILITMTLLFWWKHTFCYGIRPRWVFSTCRNYLRTDLLFCISFLKYFFFLVPHLATCIFFLFNYWINQDWVQESILAWLRHHFHLALDGIEPTTFRLWAKCSTAIPKLSL